MRAASRRSEVLTNETAHHPSVERTTVRSLCLCIRQPGATHVYFMTPSRAFAILWFLVNTINMFSRTSFGASDEELERATLSSPHSFVSVDTNESHGKHAFSNKRPRKSVSEELRPPQRLKVDPPSAMHDESSQLACPFAKHNPLRHRRCFKYKMDQISRLKQHLFRVHQVPIHCVRCSQTFSCEDERDAHLRSIPGCTIQPDKTWIGINETQKTQLTQRVSSKKSKEENWYSVYEILFPGSPRPESPCMFHITTMRACKVSIRQAD
ncbi:hypothetical protein BU23DRAFT_152762 [Bimuria novae-zelandiae CBS 107.79]|uniref:C2H2-type domain-containing protein n=1 Tax=Bimuria novae-zelandiae CBS 107.79 TaxID=1447943 RepID=A0A6A5VUG3_9PLEO|nr:hypothetical protein BU23DRAFT_152762 [Bimuria novae-zelandiae CBS 107.79]